MRGQTSFGRRIVVLMRYCYRRGRYSTNEKNIYATWKGTVMVCQYYVGYFISVSIFNRASLGHIYFYP